MWNNNLLNIWTLTNINSNDQFAITKINVQLLSKPTRNKTVNNINSNSSQKQSFSFLFLDINYFEIHHSLKYKNVTLKLWQETNSFLNSFFEFLKIFFLNLGFFFTYNIFILVWFVFVHLNGWDCRIRYGSIEIEFFEVTRIASRLVLTRSNWTTYSHSFLTFISCLAIVQCWCAFLQITKSQINIKSTLHVSTFFFFNNKQILEKKKIFEKTVHFPRCSKVSVQNCSRGCP